MPTVECPQAPGQARFHVKACYRREIANRFGSVYVTSSLCKRREIAGRSMFAPVAITPGEVLVFTWPAIPLDDSWVEPD